MAVRSLPIGYAVGSAVPVSITVQPAAGVQNYTVEDTPPPDMSVSNTNYGRLLENGKVKLGPFLDHQGRNLDYEITPPTGTQGNIGWSGVLPHDGISESICGDTVLPEGPGASGRSWCGR